MPTTVAGIYKEGKIELLEIPAGVREGRVWVTLQEEDGSKPAPRFLQRGKYKHGRMSTEQEEDNSKPAPQYLQFGKYKDTGGRMSTEEDFKIAEWHGEDDPLDD